MKLHVLALIALAATSTACLHHQPVARAPEVHDLILRNGVIFDGSGSPPFRGDLSIDGKRITAVRRLTSLPATNLRIRDPGLLRAGYFAAVVVFDPATIQDHATYGEPRQYSTGVLDVFVNGTEVLSNGDNTGARPCGLSPRAARGPIGRMVRRSGQSFGTSEPAVRR